MMAVKVVVLGRNYTSLLGMIRSAGAAGCEVNVIKTVRERSHMVKTPEAFSKYVKSYTYAMEPDKEDLIRVIKENFGKQGEKVVLLPTDDFTASAIDALYSQLGGDFLIPHIKDEVGKLTHYMDKTVQKQLAIDSGILVAQGWSIDIIDGAYSFPEDLIYPVFTKPQTSIYGNKTYMRRCNTNDDLKNVLEEISIKSNGNCHILVEQYLEIEKEYAILGCCMDEHVVIPGVLEMIKSGHGPHRGVTAQGKVLPYELLQEQLDLVQIMMKKLHFVGLFDIDLIQANNKIYYAELNLRLGASGYAITYAGANLPQIFVNYIVDGIAQSSCSIKTDIIFANEKVEIEDYHGGYISWKNYKIDIESADFFLINSQADSNPYKKFKKVVLKQRIKKLIRR